MFTPTSVDIYTVPKFIDILTFSRDKLLIVEEETGSAIFLDLAE